MPSANERTAKGRGKAFVLFCLGALAIAAVLVLGIRGNRTRSASQDRDPEHARREAGAVESPLLRGRRILDQLDMQRPQPESRTAPPTTGTDREVRIRGVVTSDGGCEPIDGAEVYAVAPAGPRVTLARVSSDESGAYRMPISLSKAQLDQRALHVGAVAPGHLRQTIEAELEEGQDLVLDFALPRGLALEGRVVDERGAPVPDLPVFVTARRETPSLSKCPVFFATDDLRLARLGSPYHEARGRTDGKGYFRVEGLGEGAYAVLTPSTSWLIRQAGRRWRPGERGIEIVALRAFSLDLALSSESGEPLPAVAGRFSVKTPGVPAYLMPLRIEGGAAQLTWASMRKGREHTQGFEVRVTLTAQGWDSLDYAVAFEAGDRHHDVELTMRRRELGRVRLTVLDDGGEPVSLPLVANLVAYEDRDNLSMTGRYQNLDPEFPGKPGQYLLTCGVGRWFASITVRHELGAAIRWTGALYVPPGAVPSQSVVTLPSFAKVAFTVTGDRAPSGTAPLRLKLRSSDLRRIVRISLDAPTRIIDGFPPGHWEYEVRRGDQHVRGEFTVRARDDIDVEIP